MVTPKINLTIRRGMQHNGRSVIAVFHAGLTEERSHGTRIVVWTVSAVIEPVAWAVVWIASSRTEGGFPLGTSTIITYYLLILLMSRLVSSWTFDALAQDIALGRYGSYLVRPVGVVLYRLGLDLSHKFVAVGALIPLWLAGMGVALHMNMLECEPGRLIYIAGAVFVAMVLRFVMDITVAHVVMWTGRADGVSIVYHAMSRLLGGITVPLVLLPEWAQSFATALPFRFMYSLPVEIAVGFVDAGEMFLGLLGGIVWIAVFVVGGAVIMRMAKMYIDPWEA
ncbi:MAG: hypothetical protein PHG63_01365 [Candidatus Dojkabacteria bacterium]|nr:hypothetical protein [Candidatus Dojkabacteria bacterium]